MKVILYATIVPGSFQEFCFTVSRQYKTNHSNIEEILHRELIHVESLAGFLTISNKKTTYSLLVANGKKNIALEKSIAITLHWIEGHAGLCENERAKYLLKTAASYLTNIDCNELPVTGRLHGASNY